MINLYKMNERRNLMSYDNKKMGKCLIMIWNKFHWVFTIDYIYNFLKEINRELIFPS